MDWVKSFCKLREQTCREHHYLPIRNSLSTRVSSKHVAVQPIDRLLMRELCSIGHNKCFNIRLEPYNSGVTLSIVLRFCWGVQLRARSIWSGCNSAGRHSYEEAMWVHFTVSLPTATKYSSPENVSATKTTIPRYAHTVIFSDDQDLSQTTCSPISYSKDCHHREKVCCETWDGSDINAIKTLVACD